MNEIVPPHKFKTTESSNNEPKSILNYSRKKRSDDTMIGGNIKKKCSCIRNKDMVTNICICLDDNEHMPLLKLPPRQVDPETHVGHSSSISPGWENYIHSGDDTTEDTSSSLEYVNDTIPVDRDQKIFCTGSNYVGQWNVLGMKGYGTYIMPHGVEYCGEFEDGQFHGNGTLTYPNGLKIRGVFERGKMIKWNLEFDDGLQYNIPWNYCKMPDRRFYPEIVDNISPASSSYITPDKPAREIPKGCYDTGDGYFDPNMKCIYSANKPNKILRVASKLEEEWILANCRRQEDHTTQYRPDLYAKFITGTDEYSLEHDKSTETLRSIDINETNILEKNMMAELLGLPPITCELTRKQFGQNVIQTAIHDQQQLFEDGTLTRTCGHQQQSDVGRSAMVSRLSKSISGTIELDIKQGVEDATSGVSTIIASSTRMKPGELKLLTFIESSLTNSTDGRKPNTKIMSGKAELSTRHGVRVDTTNMDEWNDEIEYRYRTPIENTNCIPYQHSLSIEGASIGKKKMSIDSNHGIINFEITSNPGENDHHVTDAAVNMKKEFDLPTNKEIAEISMSSYLSSHTSRTNTNIDIATDKCTSILLIETENKSGELIIDVQSFSHVEPTQKSSNEMTDKPLTLQSHFHDKTHISGTNSNMLLTDHQSSQSLSNHLNEYLSKRGKSEKSSNHSKSNVNGNDHGSSSLSRTSSAINISISHISIENDQHI